MSGDVGTPARRKAACAVHGRLPAVAACGGCGLFVCGECGGGEVTRCARCRGAGHPIPWEDPALPRATAFTRTLRALVQPSFFGTAPWTGGLGPPIRFAMVAALIGAVGSFVWGVATSRLLALAIAALGPRLGRVLEAAFDLRARGLDWSALGAQLADLALRFEAASLVLAPLNAVLEVVVLSALTLGVSRLLGGKGTYEATVRALGYAAGASVLHLVPLIGSSLGTVAWLILAIAGLRRAHGLSIGRALAAGTWWIPLAIAFVLVLSVLAVGVIARAT